MESAEPTRHEQQRLHALRALRVLDTAPEPRFDRLTRLASRTFQVPIALVSLVDEHRQWFKSRFGLDVIETPRDISFCAHAILDEPIFLVPDALLDQRFADNPLVVGHPGIRFYAGCPLTTGQGIRLGTLCIIDREPRSLSEADRHALKDLAALVEHELAVDYHSRLDELTGLLNRAGFVELAQHSLALLIRDALPACLVLIEFDADRPMNPLSDSQTPERAQERAFANLLRSVSHDADVCARLGVNRFALFLPGTAAEVADDMVAQVGQRLADHPQNATLAPTFRHRIVQFRRDKHTTVADMLAQAVAAMAG